MSEEKYKEEYAKENIIDGEHEGWGGRGSFIEKIRKRQEEERRRRQENERRIREENNRKNISIDQVKQLTAQVKLLQGTIKDKDNTISEVNRKYAGSKKEIDRLKKKTNDLIDNVQYYRTVVLGNDEVDGCATTLVNMQIKNDELLQKEIGKPAENINEDEKEGLQTIFESFLAEYNEIKNDFNKVLERFDNPGGKNIIEGLYIAGDLNSSGASIPSIGDSNISEVKKTIGDLNISEVRKTIGDLNISEAGNIIGEIGGSGAGGIIKIPDNHETEETQTSAYSAVYLQNKSIKNHIEKNKNEHSIDNQLSANIIARTEYFKKINNVLTFLFMAACLYAFYKLYNIQNMTMAKKITIGFLVVLSIFIIHAIEYFLFQTIPYMVSLLTGTPYKPVFIFSRPGKYDYFPTK